jgi:hypothetical protein
MRIESQPPERGIRNFNQFTEAKPYGAGKCEYLEYLIFTFQNRSLMGRQM